MFDSRVRGVNNQQALEEESLKGDRTGTGQLEMIKESERLNKAEPFIGGTGLNCR